MPGWLTIIISVLGTLVVIFFGDVQKNKQLFSISCNDLCSNIYYQKNKKAHNMVGYFLDTFGCKTKTPKLNSNKQKETNKIKIFPGLFQPLLH